MHCFKKREFYLNISLFPNTLPYWGSHAVQMYFRYLRRSETCDNIRLIDSLKSVFKLKASSVNQGG